MKRKAERKIKERKKRSWVWEHFDSLQEKEALPSEKWVTCKVEGCPLPEMKVILHNTTCMANHLLKHHKISKGIKSDDDESSEEEKMVIEITQADQDQIDTRLYELYYLYLFHIIIKGKIHCFITFP